MCTRWFPNSSRPSKRGAETGNGADRNLDPATGLGLRPVDRRWAQAVGTGPPKPGSTRTRFSDQGPRVGVPVGVGLGKHAPAHDGGQPIDECLHLLGSQGLEQGIGEVACHPVQVGQ